LKQRHVRFTLTAQRHVAQERAWWLTNRDYPEVLVEELGQALRVVAVLPGAGTPYAKSPIPGVRRVLAQQIDFHSVDFHSAEAIEGNPEICVQPESAAGLWQCLETPIAKCFGCASRAFGAFSFRQNRTSSRHKQARQRDVYAVAHESSNAGRVITLPEGVGRQHHVCGPARNCAGWKDNRVAHGFVPATPPIEHPREHWHVQVSVVVDPNFALAVVQTM
jgi:hypothetical protein